MNFYPNQPASISMDLHPIRPVELGVNPEIMTTKFDQTCNVIHCLLKALDLNGLTPNLTGQIRPVKLGVNPLRL